LAGITQTLDLFPPIKNKEVTLSQHYYTQSLTLASLRQDEREELERRNPKSLVDAIAEAVSILATRQVD
jgi:hypothetical protein